MDVGLKQEIPVYPVPSNTAHVDEFNITKLTFGQGRYEKTSDPHRHHHYTLMILCEGITQQFIDFKEYKAEGMAIILMRPGQVHEEINAGNALMYLITFHADFLFSRSADHHWERQFDKNMLPLISEDLQDLLPFLELLQDEYRNFPKNKTVVAHLLLALLEKTEMLLHVHTPIVEKKRYSELMRQFSTLVESHFLTHTQVADYAEKMFISSGHLNDVVKEMTGTNAKSWIDERRLLEAKRLLFWTQLPIGEVGRRIGFEDPAYFTRFFKKHTGQLPAAFQRELHKTIQH